MEVEPSQAALQPMPRPLPELDLAEPVTGIVLAGGRSRRMGGRDKAWIELAGRPLVRWVLEAMREVTDGQVLVARDEAQRERLERLGRPVAIDRYAARGPLTGIHAGLTASPTDLAVVVACDMPLVRPELLERLASSIGALHAAVPYIGEGEPPSRLVGETARDAGLQPLLAAYRRACLPPLERLLRSGPVPTTALISVLKARIVAPEEWRLADPDGRSFLNVNTGEDLAEAARRMSRPED